MKKYNGIHKEAMTTGEWEGVFYVEALDHFGLDNEDPNHRINLFTIPVFDFRVRSPLYQHLDHGFACWWTLQHLQGYVPFRTKLKFMVCLKGKIDL